MGSGSNSNVVEYVRFAEKLLEYLKTRHHTEAPHISLLSPEYSILPKLFGKHGTLLEFLDEEDLDDDLIEMLDPTRIRGHSTFGVKATFKNYSDYSSAEFKTKFYIRTAPGSCFRRVELTAKVIGEDKLEIALNIFSEDGSVVYSLPPATIDMHSIKSAVVGFGANAVIQKATKLIQKALYQKDSTIRLFSDKNLEKALGTETSADKEFLFLPCSGRGKRRVCYSSNSCLAVQNFLLEFSKQKLNGEIRLSFVFRYIGPALLKKDKRSLIKLEDKYGIPTYVYYSNSKESRLDRWAISHLFEVEGELSWENAEKAWGWVKTKEDGKEYAGLYNLEPIGSLMIEVNGENRILLRDWHVEIEEVYPVELSRCDLSSSFNKIRSKLEEELGNSIDTNILQEALDIVESALKKTYPQISQLRKFQEESLYEGLKNLLSQKSKAIVLEARTAGGKTLSFLLPLLVYAVYLKLERGEDGTKAVLIYPTTALQNDQATTLFNLLWNVNKQLRERYGENYSPLSLGLLYGLTPSRAYLKEEQSELRLPCPYCGARLQLRFKIKETDGNGKFRIESIVCPNENCRLNREDNEDSMLLQKMVKATREAIYSHPPDFLIANPDILNARLTLSAKEDPAALSILGKEVYVCRICGAVHDKKGRPRKCKMCGSEKLEKRRFGYPKVVVIDEAHLFRGAFGAQVSHLLTRLEQAIRAVNNLPATWRPLYFISSATLNNPTERAAEIVNIPKKDISTKIIRISAKLDRTHQPTKRVHVFIMPKRYSPEATVSRILEVLYHRPSAIHPSVRDVYNKELEELRHKLFSSKPTGKPTALVFVNRISEANDLLNYAKFYLGNAGVRMDGHTTDYQKDKVRVEDEFSKGNLDLVVATSGLEVGVDFDLVDVGILYGMPFYISDYTQRIGRIGRKRHSIVFNVFMPDKPVDYFYHKNWKLMCDGYLRDIHIMNEAYVIRRENPYVVRKAAKAAVLDMISTHSGAESELDKSIPGREWDKHINQLYSSLVSEAKLYVLQALGIKGQPELEKIALDSAEELIQILIDGLPSGSKLRKVIRDNRGTLNFIRSLRDVEEQTLYDFNVPSWVKDVGQRQRSIQYAFRHCVPGQIISYRGFYFVISSTEAVDMNIEEDEWGETE